MESTGQDARTPLRAAASLGRMRVLAVGSLIAAATFGLLLVTFGVRVSSLATSRDQLEQELAAAEDDLQVTSDELQVTSDELERAKVELDDTRTALDIAEDEAESLADQLDERVPGADDPGGATQSETDDLVGRIERLNTELEVAESQLRFLRILESPESVAVTIDGTWFFTWSDVGVVCENLVRVDCSRWRLAALISPTEGRVNGERVTGGRVSADSLNFSMTTTTSGDFVCFRTPMQITRNLTFHVVAGDVDGATVSALAVEGQVEIIATSDECPVGRIVLPFTAKRTN